MPFRFMFQTKEIAPLGWKGKQREIFFYGDSHFMKIIKEFFCIANRVRKIFALLLLVHLKQVKYAWL